MIEIDSGFHSLEGFNDFVQVVADETLAQKREEIDLPEAFEADAFACMFSYLPKDIFLPLDTEADHPGMKCDCASAVIKRTINNRDITMATGSCVGIMTSFSENYAYISLVFRPVVVCFRGQKSGRRPA